MENKHFRHERIIIGSLLIKDDLDFLGIWTGKFPVPVQRKHVKKHMSKKTCQERLCELTE